MTWIDDKNIVNSYYAEQLKKAGWKGRTEFILADPYHTGKRSIFRSEDVPRDLEKNTYAPTTQELFDALPPYQDGHSELSITKDFSSHAVVCYRAMNGNKLNEFRDALLSDALAKLWIAVRGLTNPYFTNFLAEAHTESNVKANKNGKAYTDELEESYILHRMVSNYLNPIFSD